MKKLFFTLCMFGFLITGYSQIELDETYFKQFETKSEMKQVQNPVGDFTITDTDGITWNLYDQLNQGITVVVDLFKTN